VALQRRNILAVAGSIEKKNKKTFSCTLTDVYPTHRPPELQVESALKIPKRRVG